MSVTVLDVMPSRSRHSRRIVTNVGTVTVPNPLIKELDLAPGTVFESLDALTAEITERAYDHARERAFRILGYRERSVHELTERLSQDGYPDQVIERVVERLLELDILDDQRFAEHLVAARRGAQTGRIRILKDLQAAGVDPGISQPLIDTYCGAQDQLDSARRALRGRRAVNAQERQKLIARLVRRGYSFETARDAVPYPAENSDDPVDK